MPYRNYMVLGLELIEEWGASAPFRMNRLITALEDFAVGGPATQAAPDVDEAEAKGANAVLAMRFDTSEMGGNWTEICAYGTAVVIEPIG